MRTALRTQLADDYLRPHGLRCGIYLVGWFICTRWEKATNKLASTDTAAARAELDALAEEYADASDLRIAPVLIDCTFLSEQQQPRGRSAPSAEIAVDFQGSAPAGIVPLRPPTRGDPTQLSALEICASTLIAD